MNNILDATFRKWLGSQSQAIFGRYFINERQMKYVLGDLWGSNLELRQSEGVIIGESRTSQVVARLLTLL